MTQSTAEVEYAQPDAGGKACPKCKQWKPAVEFTPQRVRGVMKRCRACNARKEDRPPRPVIECRHCGEPFTQKRRDAWYCKRNCWDQAQRKTKPRGPEVVDGKKTCGNCEQVKPVSEFPRYSRPRKTEYRVWCRDCTNEALRVKRRNKVGLPADAVMQRRVTSYPEGWVALRGKYVVEKRTGHHRAVKGWVRQHILVAEEKYGFPIPRGVTVHHRNNDKTDNRPENLELRVGDHGFHGDIIPTLLRSPELRAIARTVLAQYDD